MKSNNFGDDLIKTSKNKEEGNSPRPSHSVGKIF